MIEDILQKTNNQIYKKWNICGLTSPKSQHFLSLICKNKNVLEVGYYKGASTIPIASTAKYVLTVDNLSFIESVPIKNINIGNTNQTLEYNLLTRNITNVDIINDNIFSENTFNKINKMNFDIIFYDASHKIEDVFKFLMLYEKTLNNKILILDDYNFESVREAVNFFINTKSKVIKYKKEIITNSESLNDFWNGIGIFVFA